MDNKDLTEFIVSILGSLLGLSFLAELVPAWGNLSSERKILITRGVVVVLAVVAFTLSKLAPGVLEIVAEGATVVGAAVAAYGAQQAYHKLAKPNTGDY